MWILFRDYNWNPALLFIYIIFFALNKMHMASVSQSYLFIWENYINIHKQYIDLNQFVYINC